MRGSSSPMGTIEGFAGILLCWIFVGIFPSFFVGLFYFPKMLILATLTIYFIVMGFFLLCLLILDRIDLSLNKSLKRFCGLKTNERITIK